MGNIQHFGWPSFVAGDSQLGLLSNSQAFVRCAGESAISQHASGFPSFSLRVA